MSPPVPRIVIVGAGAIGAFYGAILQRAGARVEVVLRSHVDIVRARGFSIDSPMGDLSYRPAAVHHIADAATPGADVVICCVKVLPEVDRAALIAPWLGPQSAIALIENGLDIEPPVAAALPGHPLVSALAFVAVSRRAPGEIEHQAYGRLTLGAWPSGVSAEARDLAAWFEAGGIDVKCSASIVRERWAKSLWNTPFNPISVLADGADTVTLLETPGGETLARAAMTEVMAVAAADGHPLPADAVDRNIEATRRMPAYRNSMALDYRAGRALEVDAILGNVVARAEALGVAVPRLHTLRTLIAMREREAAARG
ncbi:ketopantoate reductase family protein [Salinisphaera sp. LB1]|uniref:ketopantoate reductase family protein n=1 Tax=Salinisphaera sp. LB1 TaxID=2183911 RepID=UPI000D707607|nr:2-dehydropantoate 2-reductase [Salinisphaera sp. LB1]